MKLYDFLFCDFILHLYSSFDFLSHLILNLSFFNRRNNFTLFHNFGLLISVKLGLEGQKNWLCALLANIHPSKDGSIGYRLLNDFY